MIKDLSKQLAAVFETNDVTAKRALAVDFVNASAGSAERKCTAIAQVKQMSPAQIDKFMTNYLLSGEGMKVL